MFGYYFSSEVIHPYAYGRVILIPFKKCILQFTVYDFFNAIFRFFKKVLVTIRLITDLKTYVQSDLWKSFPLKTFITFVREAL